MEDAPDEIDRLSLADLKGQRSRQISPKDNPQRTESTNQQSQCHAPRCDLPQQQPAEKGRHQWDKREHSGGTCCLCCFQALKHQNKIGCKQATQN